MHEEPRARVTGTPVVNEDKAARFHRLQRRCFWLSLATQAVTMLALVPGGVSGAHA